MMNLVFEGDTYTLTNSDIDIRLNRLSEHSGGSLISWIRVRKGGKHLHWARFDLASTTARRTLARELGEQTEEMDWHAILEEVCVRVAEHYLAGNEVEEIYTSDNYPSPAFLLEPLLIEGEPTVFFGAPKSGKSYMSDLAALCVRLPWYDNPFGWKTKEEATRVLFLDWEGRKERTGYRLARLHCGLDGVPENYAYLRCHSNFVSSFEVIRDKVARVKPGLLIIDSLGYACAREMGGLNDASASIPFWNALSSLNVTSLVLAHDQKDSPLSKGNKTIYGSQFFTAGARHIWHVRGARAEKDSYDKIVGLFHVDSNDVGDLDDIGVRFNFNGAGVTVSPADPKKTSLIEHYSQKDQLIELLRDKPMRVLDIAETTGWEENQVRTILGRYKDTFTKDGLEWTLNY